MGSDNVRNRLSTPRTAIPHSNQSSRSQQPSPTIPAVKTTTYHPAPKPISPHSKLPSLNISTLKTTIPDSPQSLKTIPHTKQPFQPSRTQTNIPYARSQITTPHSNSNPHHSKTSRNIPARKYQQALLITLPKLFKHILR